MRRPLLILAAAALALGTAGGALADPGKGKGKGKDKDWDHKVERDAGDAVVEAFITAAEIAIIADWIARNGTGGFGYPSGGHGLPPGIAKNLARGKPLPPGIAKNYLPQGLLGQLPARPGYEWRYVDNDILLVVAGTAVIVDILRDAF